MNIEEHICEIVEMMARMDAKFDGRNFDQLAKADRDRYEDRSKATFQAIWEANLIYIRGEDGILL